MTTARSAMTKLVLLKDLDSIIDFSRATNQFSIILYLAEKQQPVSITELSRAIGDSRKSILDSLRKLERKGLIARVDQEDDLYVGLSEHGREFVRRLIEVLTPVKTASDNILETPVRLNLSRELVLSINLYKLLVYVGLSKKGYATISEASKILVDAEKTLNILIESFTRSPTRFFKLIEKEGEKVLVLDKQGLEVLKKIPHYRLFNENRFYKLLVYLTGTPWLSEIQRTVNTILGVIIAVLSVGVFLAGYKWLVILGLITSLLLVVFNITLSKLGVSALG